MFMTDLQDILNEGFVLVSENLNWMFPAQSQLCQGKPRRPVPQAIGIFYTEIEKSTKVEKMIAAPRMYGKHENDGNKIACVAMMMLPHGSNQGIVYGVQFIARFDRNKLPNSDQNGKLTLAPLYPDEENKDCALVRLANTDLTTEMADRVVFSDILNMRANNGEYRFLNGTSNEHWSAGRLIAMWNENKTMKFYALISAGNGFM